MTAARTILALVLGGVSGLTPLHAQDLRDENGDVQATAPLPKSRVVITEKPSLVNRYVINAPGVRETFNRCLLAYTRKRTVAEAWGSLLKPEDVVGIKINTTGGSLLSTHRSLIDTIVEGLQSAGIPAENIIVWDKFREQMISAGYVPMESTGQWKCQSVIPGMGFDPKQFYFHEVAGQLIWGDQDFVGKAEFSQKLVTDLVKQAAQDPKDKNAPKDPSQGPTDSAPPQLSNRSYFTTIMTQEVTKVINIPVLSDHDRLGVSGALVSLSMGSVDNNRRFLSPSEASSVAIAEILDKDFMAPKAVLHIVDGLVAQYAGGPYFSPNYAVSPGIFMISSDPVALDTLSLERLEDWRRQFKVVPIGDLAGHIATCAAYGLGTNRKDDMELVVLP